MMMVWLRGCFSMIFSTMIVTMHNVVVVSVTLAIFQFLRKIEGRKIVIMYI